MSNELDGLEDEYGPVPPREVVLTEDLLVVIGPIIGRAFELWEGSKSNTRNESREMGPLGTISAASGIPERTLFRILKGESVTTDLTVADRILMALGLNLSQCLPEGAIVSEQEARDAALVQTGILRHVAKSRGEYVPARGSKEMRTWAGPYRRKLAAEAGANLIAWRS